MASLAAPSVAHAAPTSVSYGSAASGSNTVPVTVEYRGTAAKAMIPKSLSFDSKVGSYTVFAYCEADQLDALDASVTIAPEPSFVLTKSGSSDTVTATVSQDKTVFTPSDIRGGSDSTVTISSGGSSREVSVKRVDADGTVAADGITEGTWTGTMEFTVS